MVTSNRRKFLASTATASTVLTFGKTAPAILQQAAVGAEGDDGRILVVVEMAGGNDGINTIIPFKDDAYLKARPKLAIPPSDVLKVTDELGFHQSLSGFAGLLDAGSLAVVQGVGYPNPNRSHFESMDIWHTCQRKNENRSDGWLGRFLEATNAGDSSDPMALHLGSDKQPFALMSRDVRVPSIRSLDEFRLAGNESAKFKMAVKGLADARRTQSNDLLGFVQSSTSSAIAASERIESAGMKYKPAVEYPANGLAAKLKTTAKLINSGLGTRVYYMQINGFDTHSQQANAHAALLRQVSSSVTAFINDAVAHGHGERVMCLCFSEFGRRVAENASGGTDHGTAGPVFLAGTQAKSGLIGRKPNLADLNNGDLKHHTDFRQIYATVLSKWFSIDSRATLKGSFEPIDAIAT